MTPCSSVDTYQIPEESAVDICPEDPSSSFPSNIAFYLPNYTTSHCTKPIIRFNVQNLYILPKGHIFGFRWIL
jgi:hypothetical protein